jgi:hypothetical protein
MPWAELEAAAPEIARPGRARLEAARVALLGTLRKDGSPRISPIEPYFTEGHLLFGAMAWSLKAKDLGRDPRCVVHSAVTGPDAGEGELKLYGRAAEAEEDIQAACRDGWWIGRPAESAFVFTLMIDAATFVEWDYGSSEMIVKRWSPQRGFRLAKRGYP